MTMRGHENDNAVRLWRIDADGSNLKRITNGENDSFRSVRLAESGCTTPAEANFPGCVSRSTAEMRNSCTPTSAGGSWGVFLIIDLSPDERRFVTFSTRADTSTNTYTRKLGIFNADSAESPAALRHSESEVQREARQVFALLRMGKHWLTPSPVTRMRVIFGCNRSMENRAGRLPSFTATGFLELTGRPTRKNF